MGEVCTYLIVALAWASGWCTLSTPGVWQCSPQSVPVSQQELVDILRAVVQLNGGATVAPLTAWCPQITHIPPVIHNQPPPLSKPVYLGFVGFLLCTKERAGFDFRPGLL